MRLAFATGALASGVVGAGLTALVVWVATIVTGSHDPWSVAPVAVTMVAALIAGATYLAERVVYHRSQQQRRTLGDPWAYRED